MTPFDKLQGLCSILGGRINTAKRLDVSRDTVRRLLDDPDQIKGKHVLQIERVAEKLISELKELLR